MKDRALLIIDNLQLGGAQQILLLTARQLIARGWQVQVISMANNKPNAITEALETLPDMRIAHFSSGFYDLRTVFAMAKLIREFKPDVVETHLLRGNTAGLLAARLAGIPVVAVMHAGAFGKEIKHRSYNYSETFLVRHFAQRIVAVGVLVRDFQQKRFPSRKIDVIPNSVQIPPEGRTNEKRALARGLLNISEDVPLVLAVGRMSVQKAYPDMFEAFARVLQQFPQARLIVFGGGTLLEEMRKLVDSMGLSGSVTLPGAVSDPPQYLAAGDVYILSSHSEGLPVAMLEAMAAELPVVATAVGEVPVIINDECGILLRAGDIDGLADGMLCFLQDKERGRRTGMAGRAVTVERYSIDKTMDKLEELFREVMKQGRA